VFLELSLSLKGLQMKYIDLYLIHSPVGWQYVNDKEMTIGRDGTPFLDMTTNLESIWESVEGQVEEGLVRSIGASNYNISHVRTILSVARI